MNLGLLSIYPSLFSTKEARTAALVPQQASPLNTLNPEP
jgi:hypothetical protein